MSRRIKACKMGIESKITPRSQIPLPTIPTQPPINPPLLPLLPQVVTLALSLILSTSPCLLPLPRPPCNPCAILQALALSMPYLLTFSHTLCPSLHFPIFYVYRSPSVLFVFVLFPPKNDTKFSNTMCINIFALYTSLFSNNFSFVTI